MTITLKNVDSTTLEVIKNLQKIQKNLEIEIQGEKDFEALRKKMLKKLELPKNKAVFERLKDK
ncbi:hypothetical protein [uncultured Helicobacter sp.]|uniref:hypothetical protein n=1 Tax=uncultured Helicobacter sp. TaxID=175537 RepID=UPI003752DF82